jgi:site-specific DNA recombinase
MSKCLFGVAPPAKCCAIYTRKSLNLGLDRDFNTLEAQRAICSAYVTSQSHKGWRERAEHYDDGGYSGASLNRPMMQQLLGDIERGLVDVVVVYKLDRMTRTLIDFVRLVDFFERHNVVFVSITQNFDTADSMGRLVLNVLLTFAQFEREMASDRARDKILAAKQSGRWTGGPAPIGYDLLRRRLQVNPEEAAIVRRIFQRYVELENLTAVFEECRTAGVHGKKWRTRAEKTVGGRPITKALIFHIIENPIYLGLIRHHEKTYAGLHAPIIDQATWDKVRCLRAEQSRRKAYRNAKHILTDLLFDCFGRPMSVSETLDKRYKNPSRFYMSRQTAWGERQALKRFRADAFATEALVVTALVNFLSSRDELRSMLLDLSRRGEQLDKLSRRAQETAKRFKDLSRQRQRLALHALIKRIELSLERVKIVLRCNEVERFLQWDGIGIFRGEPRCRPNGKTHLLDIPADSIRTSRALALPIEPRKPRVGAHPSPALKRLIREARSVQALVDQEREKSVRELASEIDYTPNRFARILRLNYLAPDIILSILDGTHPPGLTCAKLVRASLPMNWALQRRLLGFPDRAQPEGGE